MTLIGYAVGFAESVRPMIWITVNSVDRAREVAAEMQAKPGATLTFEIIRDGRAEVLKLEKTKEEIENGKSRTNEIDSRCETARRIWRESKAIA